MFKETVYLLLEQYPDSTFYGPISVNASFHIVSQPPWRSKSCDRLVSTAPASIHTCTNQSLRSDWSHVTCYMKSKIVVSHTRYERWRRSVEFSAGERYFSLHHWFPWIPTVTSRELYFRSWKASWMQSFCLSQSAVLSKEDLWDSSICSTTCFDEWGVSKRLQLLLVFKQSFKWMNFKEPR